MLGYSLTVKTFWKRILPEPRRALRITLGKTYAQPVVDHQTARHRAHATLTDITGAYAQNRRLKSKFKG